MSIAPRSIKVAPRTGNAVNSVRLSQASAATFQIAAQLDASTVMNNTGGDLQCLDGESSFEGVPSTATAGIGTISCTSF